MAKGAMCTIPLQVLEKHQTVTFISLSEGLGRHMFNWNTLLQLEVGGRHLETFIWLQYRDDQLHPFLGDTKHRTVFTGIRSKLRSIPRVQAQSVQSGRSAIWRFSRNMIISTYTIIHYIHMCVYHVYIYIYTCISYIYIHVHTYTYAYSLGEDFESDHCHHQFCVTIYHNGMATAHSGMALLAYAL